MKNNDDEWVPVRDTELKQTTLDKLVRLVWGLVALGVVCTIGGGILWLEPGSASPSVPVVEETRIVVTVPQSTPTPSVVLTEIVSNELSAHYPLDGNGLDTSGNKHEALVYGAQPAVGRFGKPDTAYAFDGLDDYLTVGNDLINEQAFSVSVWVNTSREKTLQRIMTNHQPCSNTDTGFAINYWGADSSRGLGLHFGNANGYVDYDVNLADGQWHHITISSNGGLFTLYVDGSFAGQIPLVYKPTSVPLDFGRAAATRPDCGEHANSNFEGRMDDIRIYNYALSQSEVIALYQLTDDGQNLQTATADYTHINESNSAFYGATLTADHLGRESQAYRFDGQGGFIHVQDYSPWARQFSTSLWFKLEADKFNHLLIGNYQPCSYSETGFYLMYYGTEVEDGPYLQLSNGGRDGAIKFKKNLVDGAWHHAVIVFDEQAYRLYVDGELIGTQPGLYSPTQVDLKIGRAEPVRANCGGDTFLHGVVSDIRLYKEVLDTAKIEALYTAP